MKSIKRYYIITLLLSLFMMGLIFYFSAADSDRSSALSGGITARVLEILKVLFPGWITEEKWYLFLETLETPIRKMAHFTEYFFLGMILQSHLDAIGRIILEEQGRLLKRQKLRILAVCLSILYACSDELHQFFVPGRACRLFDVMVDSTGVFCGTLVFCLILWRLLDGLLGKG